MQDAAEKVLPVLFVLQATLPAGVPGSAVTAAPQARASPTATGAVPQSTVVCVAIPLTVMLVLPLLPLCLASPPYVPVTVWVPRAVWAVTALEQCAVVLASLPFLVREQVPPSVHVTVPDGRVFVPPAVVSFTSAVHVVLAPGVRELSAQLTEVLDARFDAVSDTLPLEAACEVFPP